MVLYKASASKNCFAVRFIFNEIQGNACFFLFTKCDICSVISFAETDMYLE